MIFYNKVILIGTLAESPDVRYAPNGSQVMKLALQITPERGAGEADASQTVEVLSLQREESKLGQQLSKGSRVFVEGKLQSRRFKTTEGQRRIKLEIIAERVYPLSDGSQG